MGTGRRHESIAPSPPADLMALRLVRAEHPGPGGPLAAMSIAGGTAMSDLGPHHFPKSLCDCHTPQAIQEAGAAQLKKQHVELSVLLGERTQQVRALEADCAHAKAAHLNCAVVKRDLEKAEAEIAALAKARWRPTSPPRGHGSPVADRRRSQPSRP